MENLKAIELVWSIKKELGERDWAASHDDEYNIFSEEEVVEAIDMVLKALFSEFDADFCERFITYEDLTFGSSTAEVALTEQLKLYKIIRVEDANSKNPVRRITYDQYLNYQEAGQQAYWFRKGSSGHTVGLTFPQSITTLRVWYVPWPRTIIGGMGVTDGGSTSDAYIPYWGPSTASYYATTNYVETIQISNHRPDRTTRRVDAVTSSTTTLIKWNDGAVNTGDNVFWCLQPEFAPYGAKDYIVLAAVAYLKEGRLGEVSKTLVQRVEVAKRLFVQRLNNGQLDGLNPPTMIDWID